MIFSTTLYLNRFAYLPQCTLGKLFCPGFPVGLDLVTLERPWLRNPSGPGGLPYTSCVPDGEYTLTSHNTQKHPDTFEMVNPLLGVYNTKPVDQPWGRDECLIHNANYVHQLEGCIALGKSFQWDTIPWVKESVAAMKVFRNAIKSLGFSHETPAKLIIQPSKGTVT